MGTDSSVLFLPEPPVLFRHGQAMEDPRDGLMIFGPLDEGRPYGVRAGVIGTRHGIKRYSRWVARLQGRLADRTSPYAKPPFPGFESVFRVPWASEPVVALEIPEHELRKAAHLDDRHQRVYRTVDLYANPLIDALRREEAAVDLWFIVIPDFVHETCRPLSRIEPGQVVKAQHRMSPRRAQVLGTAPSLFAEENMAAVPYQYDVDFHNQLKARLLSHKVPTQIVRESTIAAPSEQPPDGAAKRDMSALQGSVAWHLSTAAFYKAGGRPWKIASIREGVCYVGLVFKQDEKHPDPRTACCAAQMFLDSGDGVVFRGAVGPWHTPGRSEFHLTRNAARELVTLAVASYRERVGREPAELFIHGKVYFEDDEWRGFRDAVGSGRTSVVGVRIRDEQDFRLYTQGSHPVLRGVAYVRHPRSAYLWTRGYTPRLRTYVGREVPRPLRVDILRGVADLRTVLMDILALTKLNYNACIFADGLPVTLRFADVIGEILTAGPVGNENPLPFKYYI